MSCLLSHLPLVGAASERFSPYAVETRTGPHVTIQAGVHHAGRFWTTTSRSSLKARSVRAHSFASMVMGQDGIDGKVFAGSTLALDATRPLDVLADPFSSLFAAGAVLRLGSEQIAQIVGYLESASAIPSGWFPHRRVLLVTDIDRSIHLEEGRVTDATGAWDRPATPLVPTDGSVVPLPRRQLAGMERADFGELLDSEHPVRLGVSTPDGPVAVPGVWASTDTVEVSSDALGAIRASLPGRGCVTVDDSTSRRPDRKLGMMFRGSLTLHSVGDHHAVVGIDTERITTWDGFDASTIDVDRHESNPASA